MGFDRKKDFRSNFKEDGKSNDAPKKCRKQREAAHGRAPSSTAVLQRQWSRTAVRPTERGRATGRAAATCSFFFCCY